MPPPPRLPLEDDVFTFGLGQFGQLGHGTFIFESRLPRPVEHFRRGRVRQVSCGENHTAVVTGKLRPPLEFPKALEKRPAGDGSHL